MSNNIFLNLDWMILIRFREMAATMAYNDPNTGKPILEIIDKVNDRKGISIIEARKLRSFIAIVKNLYKREADMYTTSYSDSLQDANNLNEIDSALREIDRHL
jgi:hypothetical protein